MMGEFRCVFCNQASPSEWGAGRRCPEFPDKDRPKYMQQCEFGLVAVERPLLEEAARDLLAFLARVEAPADKAGYQAHRLYADDLTERTERLAEALSGPGGRE